MFCQYVYKIERIFYSWYQTELKGITIEVNRNTAGLNNAIKETLDLASAIQQKTKYILIFGVSYLCLMCVLQCGFLGIPEI